jgi:hypothetical protein
MHITFTRQGGKEIRHKILQEYRIKHVVMWLLADNATEQHAFCQN